MRFVCASCAYSVVNAVLGVVPLCTRSSCMCFVCWHYLWKGGWASGQSKSCVHAESTGNVYLWTQGNTLLRGLKMASKQRQLYFVLVLYNKLSSEEKTGNWAWYSGTARSATASTVQCERAVVHPSTQYKTLIALSYLFWKFNKPGRTWWGGWVGGGSEGKEVS